jgi:nitrile hydratase accessory protein
MPEVDERIANLNGESALPRKNGELVFKAPWEGRAFGMAVALYEKGTYTWESFRAELIKSIAGGTLEYYESWLNAFESLLVDSGLVTAEEICRRAAEYKALERDPVF